MKAVLSPSVAMGAAAAAVGEKRGILFGPERTGLDNDEVAIADAIITFPSSPTYASLNLSQAVLLCGYEWFKAAHGDAPPPRPSRASSRPRRSANAARLFDFLEDKLEENGFPARDQEAGHAAKTCATSFIAWSRRNRTRTLWGRWARLVEGRGSRSRRVSGRARRRPRPDPHAKRRILSSVQRGKKSFKQSFVWRVDVSRELEVRARNLLIARELPEPRREPCGSCDGGDGDDD
jgi:tRNA/rRNA methyltransferase